MKINILFIELCSCKPVKENKFNLYSILDNFLFYFEFHFLFLIFLISFMVWWSPYCKIISQSMLHSFLVTMHSLSFTRSIWQCSALPVVCVVAFIIYFILEIIMMFMLVLVISEFYIHNGKLVYYRRLKKNL